MQFHQVQEQPHTYIVENDYGKQLGTVDEFHRNEKVSYIATRFNKGTFEQKEFPGFTAALNSSAKGTEANKMAFPFCEFEDSQNCIWFAPMQGNGKGDSFVNFMGHILYAE